MAIVAIAIGLLYQSVPEIAPVDPDPVHPLVPIFSIRNPSPFFTMHNMRWDCEFDVVGTDTHINMPGMQKRVELAPGSSSDHRCTKLSVRTQSVIALKITLRFKTFFLTRTVASRPLFWLSERGLGRWIKAEDIPVPFHPTEQSLRLGNEP